MASYLDKMSARAWSWWCLSSNIVIERGARSVIAGRRTMLGMDRMCCWISGARHRQVGGHPARQGADPSTGLRAGVAVFEGALRPECDLDGVFAIFRHAVAPVQGEVYNTKVDLRLRQPGRRRTLLHPGACLCVIQWLLQPTGPLACSYTDPLEE